MEFFPPSCFLKQMQECTGILLPAFCLFSFLLLTRNASSRNQLKSASWEAFSSNTINCSSFCENRRHRRDSAFRRAREADAENIRLFFLPFFVPECGILPRLRHSFLLPFPFFQKQKSRRRTEKRGRDSLLQKIHQGKDRGKTKRKAKIREKTKKRKRTASQEYRP